MPSANRPLRVGITCYPTFGGSGIIATEIGLSLARRGHRVHFICYDVPGRLDRYTENVYFHEVEVREYPLFEHSTYPLTLASKMVEVSTYQSLDLLHVHYAIPHAVSAYLARQILRQSLAERAPKVITTLHGTDITLVGKDRAFLPITRFAIEESDCVTTPSAFLRQATYENLGVSAGVRIDVIPNFVDTEKYRPATEKRWEELRPQFDRIGLLHDGGDPSHNDAAGARGRPYVLFHNSNFRPLKRIDDAIRVLALVRKAVPAVLVLVGDGPERSHVEGLARELGLSSVVSFVGKQLDFVELLKNADVFLMPSATESFGLAALEALACGIPVVASRVGGVPEVITDGVDGYLCKMGDVEGMAERVIGLCKDRRRHEEMSQRARQGVLQRFAREALVDKYEALYRRILQEPAPTQ